MKAEQGFQFERFRVGNPWTEDAALRLVILHLMQGEGGLPADQISRAFAGLEGMGDKIAGEYADIAATLDGPAHEPVLVQYDAWGQRVDKLVTGEGWRRLKAVAASEGIVDHSYGEHRARLGRFARLLAFVRIVMFAPVSKVVLCPVSMSDGAARVLELYGTSEQRKLIPRLCSTDTGTSILAGQWMTERPGGSDVSRTETVARPLDPNNHSPKAGDTFVLDGFKWFSSATDGDIALALARTHPDTRKGSKGLSLFLVHIRDPNTGRLNGIRVHRLKRKLGTKYLPTAELELDGCVGQLVGDLGRGVATISSVLNITRLYSASGAVGGLSWGLRSATAYAAIRPALGGTMLNHLPLHNDQLLKVTVLYRAYLQIFFNNVLLMGAAEAGTATQRERTRLRLLTPALKAFVATRATEAYLTLIESFGGQGYMEEVGMGEMLRDLSVERIWEGTPAILALDVLRVVVQTGGQALTEFFEDAEAVLAKLPSSLCSKLAADVSLVRQLIQGISSTVARLDVSKHMKSNDLRFARPLLDLLMSINASILLLQHAGWLSTSQNGESLRHAGIKCSDAAGKVADEQAEIARLWISGGMGDLQRSFDHLSAAVADKTGEVDLAKRIVYAWRDSRL